ncbi:hypothetical protein T310_6373 [Rasamsonia emersonii CBS 393.64]|uniref:CorA-like transporter domain-containing protein n=1 Tax=Rasamsonia emersonii (strain ATCC 16479 / CBS 393.64 / IMI 116815) TaxID=1408163 RepID=A0A0F4YN54_RASE3|nr:hypothetical protein T310_6373 [Rasamsonia emersonii CBS 393.64]KKA19654.1 hypothetical protein T310_6373 [Rasamsonia emersonii CBS 393.64]
MASHFAVDELALLREKIDQRAPRLFQTTKAGSQLEVVRLSQPETPDGEKESNQNQQVDDRSQIEALRREANNCSQLFIIRQKRSWTNLDIFRDLFEDFIGIYDIFPQLWKCLFAFGKKLRENEFEFPGFITRCTYPVDTDGSEICELSPWYIHWLLLADSSRGWGDYMAWLEEQLREQSEPILFARVGVEKDSRSHLDDFQVSFVDRQKLKQLEDYITDLQVILDTMVHTATGIRTQCLKWCSRNCTGRERCCCESFLEEFNRFVNEAQMHLSRAQVLHEKVQSTAKLLSNLLDYEEANALKGLARASHEEGRLMSVLTVSRRSLPEKAKAHLTRVLQLQGTRDAAAVKILTIISLIYLPTTIVANFFSTVFVHTNNQGDIQVSAQVWIMAAASIPLTSLTIALWWAWVHFAPPLQANSRQSTLKNAYGMLRSLFSRGRSTQRDLESGMACPQFGDKQFTRSPTSVSTWSTTATAFREK